MSELNPSELEQLFRDEAERYQAAGRDPYGVDHNEVMGWAVQKLIERRITAAFERGRREVNYVLPTGVTGAAFIDEERASVMIGTDKHTGEPVKVRWRDGAYRQDAP